MTALLGAQGRRLALGRLVFAFAGAFLFKQRALLEALVLVDCRAILGALVLVGCRAILVPLVDVN